jgi:hypothetical protein
VDGKLRRGARSQGYSKATLRGSGSAETFYVNRQRAAAQYFWQRGVHNEREERGLAAAIERNNVKRTITHFGGRARNASRSDAGGGAALENGNDWF